MECSGILQLRPAVLIDGITLIEEPQLSKYTTVGENNITAL